MNGDLIRVIQTVIERMRPNQIRVGTIIAVSDIAATVRVEGSSRSVQAIRLRGSEMKVGDFCVVLVTPLENIVIGSYSTNRTGA